MNSMNSTSATPITTSVLCVWCTTTLSMMTWVKSGIARPISWITSEASSTSRQTRLCFSSSGMNQRKPKRAERRSMSSGSAASSAVGVMDSA